MSNKAKGNGKDKKKDADGELQKHYEQQKRQILQQGFTIKKLQDRLSRLTQQNYEIVSTKDNFHAQYEQKIDKNRILIESHETTIKQKSNKIYQLQVQRITLKNKISNLQRDLRESQAVRVREFQQYKRLTQGEITKLESQLKQYNFYMAEKDKMESENDKLKRNLQDEKETKTREIADKEREKVQATDKLRDQMLTKIRDMRTNLLSLKKQQLSTTTRLAVLQNHQLTSQLEFQSKQSEKLIFQNLNLTKKVSNLQKDLQIHKQIQQELAKRSHYSRGIIKKLTAKIGELEQEMQNSKKSATNSKLTSSAQGEKVQHTSYSPLQDVQRKEEIIIALKKSLEFTEQKYLKLESQLQTFKNQNSSTKTKLDKYEKTTQQLCGIMTKYYEEFQAGNLQLKNHETGFVYDLKSMRKRKVEEWKTEQIRLVLLTLLNKLSSKVNRKMLGIPAINKNILTVEDDDDLIPKIRFPKISEHSAITKISATNINSSSSQLDLRKIKDFPISMASKIVASNVREWGRTVQSNSVSHLSRKFKINDK